MEEKPKSSIKLLYANFNQDSSCFSVGTEKGFSIFQVYPFKEGMTRDLRGGIGIVEMLYRTNIIALVGGGKTPKFPGHKVTIWDDQCEKIVREYRFITVVKNIRLRPDRLIVVCPEKIFIFKFSDNEQCDTYETIENPKGLIAIPSDKNCKIIAFPGKKLGEICIVNIDTKQQKFYQVHQSPLSCISLNHDGTLIASASEKGTIIKVTRVNDGANVQELKRGNDKAEIYSIAFDPIGKYVAISSDRKTIHVFVLNEDILQRGNVNIESGEVNGENSQKNNSNSNSSDTAKGKISNIFSIGSSFFHSDRSFAFLKINETKSICTFGPENKLIVISHKGKIYVASFDVKKGGECKKLLEKKIFENKEVKE